MSSATYALRKSRESSNGRHSHTSLLPLEPGRAWFGRRAEARRRRSESVGGFAGDGDDGFGTDAEGGFETSDDESDGTPRRHAADDQDSGGFAEFANDQEGGLHSYRALVTGRIGRDDA